VRHIAVPGTDTWSQGTSQDNILHMQELPKLTVNLRTLYLPNTVSTSQAWYWRKRICQ
jgi:hypothetical protein